MHQYTCRLQAQKGVLNPCVQNIETPCRCSPGHVINSIVPVQLSYSPNDEVLASAGYDQAVKVWDCRSRNWEPVQIMRAFADSVTSVTITSGCGS